MGLVTPSRHVRNPQPIDNGVPDGSQLAYHNPTSDGQYGLFIRTIATGKSAKLRVHAANRSSGCWMVRVWFAPCRSER